MIYFVEDDDNIRELVVYTLKSTGFDARGFGDGEDFTEALASQMPELVLLDIMLPGEDGMELLKQLKAGERTKDIPVIMVTAKGTEYDKVMGLDAGADDYVAKPFGMMELVSRVKAVIRRSRRQEQAEDELITVHRITIDTKRREVKSEGKLVHLTLKEYELLRILMRNPGMVYTRDCLLEDIWGYDYSGETRTVDVHVRTLRQKLGRAGEQIETVRGVGYRMRAEDSL